jgi:hypothetical protein
MISDLRAEIVEVRLRLRVRAQQDLIAGNRLYAGTSNLRSQAIFEVSSHFQVLSDAYDKNLVEGLSVIFGIEPTRDDFDGLAIDRSESSQNKHAQNN